MVRLYVPALVGVNLPSGIISPFTLIVTVPLLLVIYFIVISFPTIASIIGSITTVVFAFETLMVVFIGVTSVYNGRLNSAIYSSGVKSTSHPSPLKA